MSRVQIEEGTVADVYNYDIIINNVKYPNTFRADSRIDRTLLEDEFANQSDKYAYWSTLAALAKDQEARLKRICELVYATSDAAAREEARQLQAAGEARKFTEKIYETMAKTNQNYQKTQIEWLDAKRLADVLTRAEHAMAQRKEMLISLGAHARVGASDVRVMGAQIRERVQRKEPEPEQEQEVNTEQEQEKPISRRRKPRVNK